MTRWLTGCLLCLVPGLSGCGNSPAARPGQTGAAEAAGRYLHALAQHDWVAAYDALDSSSQSARSQDQFIHFVEGYFRQMGFEPQAVHLRACQERGEEAIAHIQFRGAVDSSPRFFKDALELRRGPTGWAVVLRSDFGKPQLIGNPTPRARAK
jgi:hypothetical protein